MRKTKLLDWDVVISAQKETSNNLHMEEGCRIILYSVKVGKCWARRSIFIHVLSSASRESLFLCLLVTTLALWAADLSMLHSQECWGTKSKAFFFFPNQHPTPSSSYVSSCIQQPPEYSDICRFGWINIFFSSMFSLGPSWVWNVNISRSIFCCFNYGWPNCFWSIGNENKKMNRRTLPPIYSASSKN